MPDLNKYFLNNKPAAAKDVKGYRHFVSVNDDYEKDSVYVFKSSKDFERWTRSTRYAEDFAKHFAQISEAQKRKEEDHAEERMRLAKDERQVAKQLKELSRELKLPVDSLALIKEARTKGILNSFIVYDRLNQGGNWRVGHWPIADYNWIRFDKMPRSIIGWGLHSFYRGAWWPWWDFTWWMVGVQWTNLPWWIDGRVSSSW